MSVDSETASADTDEIETLARQLGEAITDLPEYEAFEEAKAEVEASEEAQEKIAAVEERMINEYGYDRHSAREALNYVTTLLSQE
jgi:cell fate (sporulation/competence/biofilm development) regulator YlbF (YheA/YmcA/DUF963 family)